jgi:fructose-1,6-bisphosphatase/inositol monophosphatase family enzyme
VAAAGRHDLQAELKPDHSIVTRVDRDVEALFAAAFDRPQAGSYLLGEETIDKKGEDYIARALEGKTCVLDPIDGTAPFAHGLPHWGISIGWMEAGRLREGAVYLPEMHGGEMVLSRGPAVIEGTRRDGVWSWRELAPAAAAGRRGATMIAISQDLAKRGRFRCVEPVQALGSAVVPLIGLLQGRFLAYLGGLKLWDVAGCLPLLSRLGLGLSHFGAPAGRALDLEVSGEHYVLDAAQPSRWAVRGGLLACAPEDEESLRRIFRRQRC